MKTQDTVGVHKAIRRGRILLKVVPIGLAVLSVTLFYIALFVYWTGYDISLSLIFLSGIFVSGVAWMWWAYWVVEWKIWAFTHVQDIHLLYERALQRRLFYSKQHFLSKTEWDWGHKRKTLSQLEKRLKEQRIRRDLYR